MTKLPETYDRRFFENAFRDFERRINELKTIKIKRFQSVSSEHAANLTVNEIGYILSDTQDLDLVVKAEDGRMYRLSAIDAEPASEVTVPSGVYVLKSGDTMTGLLILSGDPSTALGAATKQYADTKVADTGDTMTGALVVDGSADAVQLKAQGHSTQTNNIFEVENSSAVDQFTVSNSGKAFVAGEAEIDGAINHDGSEVGFYGVTPATRPAAYTQTYSAATRTHSNPTASALTDNSGGTANTTVQALTDPANTPLTADDLRDDLVANLIPEIRNNFADLAAQINALIVDVANAKQVLNQAIDDQQTNGLFQ